ncbi:VWA domain-containing protein [Corynebacterium mycetoides]|nr:VWA domain-containing protein [Corynebacterium mycetoides]
MKRRRIRHSVTKAAAMCAAAIGVLSTAPAPAQEPSPDSTGGLVVTDSPWTAVTSDGSVEAVDGVVPEPSTAPPTEPPTEQPNPLTTMDTMLAEPQVVGDVSFEYTGPAPDGTQVYQLEADVIFPQTPDGQVLADPEVSFVREESAVPLVDVSDPAIDGVPVPETSVDVFAYPAPDSEAALPEDVTGDLITFDTQSLELEGATTFSTEVHLASVEEDPAAWSLYTGAATATALNAEVTALEASPMQAPNYGQVPADRARLVVQVGGDRLTTTTNSATNVTGRVSNVYKYKGEPGAVLQLYRPLNDNSFGNEDANNQLTANVTPVAINQPWATCTSDINGECVFDIPVSIFAPGTEKYYWVAMTKASPGFEVQSVIRTGGGGGDAPAGVDLRYAYATPYMRDAGGQTLYSGVRYRRDPTYILGRWGSDWETSGSVIPTSFMNEAPSADFYRTDWGNYLYYGMRQDRSALGVFQQVRSNPPLSNRCGLNVGFIVDTSNSVGTSGMSTIKAILNGGRIGGWLTGRNIAGVLPSLKSTGTRVGLVSFGNSSPGSSSQSNQLTPLSLNNATQFGTATNWVNVLNYSGGTNWEAGLRKFVDHNETQLSQGSRGDVYDVVFMITDGNPTFLDTRTQPDNGRMGEFRHVEAAMGVANTLKSQGTRVIPVGIPSEWTGFFAPDANSQLSVSDPNLQALSGGSKGGSDSRSLRATDFITFTDAEVFQQALLNTLNECSVTVERRLYEGKDPNAVATPSNTRATLQESASWSFDGTLVPMTGATTTQSGKPVATAGSDNLLAKFNLNGTTGYKSITVREPSSGVPADWLRMDAAGGYNAQCTDSAGTPVSVTDVDPRDPNTPTNDFQLTNVPVTGGIHCVVYYRLAPTDFDLRLHKVDAENRDVGLDGAAFQLARLGVTAADDAIVPPTAQASGGVFAWDKLEPGRYRLTETRAATGGYSLLPQPVYFRVARENGQLALYMLNGPTDQTGTRVSASNQILTFPVVGFEAANNQVTMKVANVRVGEMPDTGGIGVAPWLVAGLTISALGAAFAAHGRRRVA